jgi:glutamate synthase (NADPH) large chain
MVALERIAPAQGGEESDAPRQRSASAYDSGMGDPLRFDAERLRILVERHHLHTGSARAKEILDNWDSALTRFYKVMPTDYAKALADLKRERGGLKSVAAE